MADQTKNIKKKDTKKNEGPKVKKAVVLPAPANDWFVNRELSWLEFNLRVLQEAADHTVPLLERLKFLMIYQSNMEEFFRVRVGILTHREKLLPNHKDPVSGWTPAEQVAHILAAVRKQQALAESVWKTLKEEMKADGIDILDFKKISKVDELMCKKHFGEFRHLLAPRIMDLNQPLPFMWGGESYVVAFVGREPAVRLAVVPLNRLPAYTAFELDGRQKIVLTAQLVRRFLPILLKKEEIRESAVIRVTRNADVFIEDRKDNDDFRDKMSNMLRKRKREMPVRLQIFGKLSQASKAILVKKIGVPEHRVFTTTVPFDLSFRSSIRGGADYKYEERKPAKNIGLKKGEYIDYIDKHDLLLSFPFQSMNPFVDLLYEAADDPEVISIKITLYRLSNSSKVAAALAYAADRGKDVLCLLELRARFDEQSNIDYSEMLEDAGCRIIYGLPGQKVHSKLCLITRQSEGNLKHITQVGTGNYNEVTSEQYTDLSLITSDEGAAADAEAAFRALEAGEFPPEAKTLWIAPLSFKSRVIEMLQRERGKGAAGRVCIKVNSLNNRDIMNELIECSRAGVKIELFIRGICCLKPGIPDKTENITIKSVVGRWLEHSRVYAFGEGEDERIFIGSGDLLNRNLERRVEAFIEVRTPETREQIHEVLNAFREDKEKARTMQPDGSYLREEGGEGTSSQERLYWYFYNRKICKDEEMAVEESEVAEEPVITEATVEQIPVTLTDPEEEPATAEEPESSVEPEATPKAEPEVVPETAPEMEPEAASKPELEAAPKQEQKVKTAASAPTPNQKGELAKRYSLFGLFFRKKK